MKITADIHGASLVELARTVQYTPNKLPVYTRTWKGVEASINSKVDELLPLGYNCQTQEGALFTLTATVATDNIDHPEEVTELEYVFSLLGKTTEKDLVSAQIPLMTGYSKATGIYSAPLAKKHIQVLQQALKDPPEQGHAPPFDFSFRNGETAANVSPYSAAHPDQIYRALAIWQLIQNGVRTVPVTVPILRKSATVPLNYNLSRFLTGATRIYRTSNLIASEEVPLNFSYVLPNDIDPTPAENNGITAYYGWLKSYPQIDEVSNGQIQVNLDWEYGLWAYAIYGNPL